MENSPKMNGKVYNIHVKDSAVKDFNANDLIYGIAYEGSAGLSFTNFRTICEKNNKKCFLSKKCNVADDKSCSWVEISAALDDWPILGNPGLILVETPVTFYDTARLAYEKGIFTDQEGLARLDAIAEKKGVSEALASTGSNDFQETFQKTLATTMATAKDLDAHKGEVNMKNFSQSGAMLANLETPGFERGIGSIDVEVIDDEYWLKKSKEELGSIIDEYKNRAILAEDKVAALDVALLKRDKKIDVLEATVVSLKGDLVSAKRAAVSFMASGDKAAVELQKVGEGTAHEIIEGLKPFISGELSSLKSSMTSVVDMLGSMKISFGDVPGIKDTVENLSNSVPKSFKVLTCFLEAKEEESSEGFETVAATLDKFGLGASASAFDVPGSLSSILTSMGSTSPVASTPPPPPLKPHGGACTFQMVQGQSNTLACTMGCVQPVHTVPAQAPMVQNFAVPPPSFVSGAPGNVLGDSQFLQNVVATTPVATKGNLRGGLAKQMKQKIKYQQFKAKKQQQLQSDDHLVYVGGQAYQRVQQQHQVQGQQQFVQLQQASGNYLLNPSSNALVGPPSQSSHQPADGAGGSNQFYPGHLQGQGQQYHH